MNYNQNAVVGNPAYSTRRLKRVSDVNAMGLVTPMPDSSLHIPTNAETTHFSHSTGHSGMMYSSPQMSMVNDYDTGNTSFNSQQYVYSELPTSQTPTTPISYNVYNSGIGANQIPGQMDAGVNQFPQFAMFQQPIVQDIAMQYGQQLADQGKQLVENQFLKWVPVSKLKYYFAVDNNYVIRKLRIIFFPFVHKDWSVKYDQENPVQPRYDINAPDLYIPTMAFITYVVVAGLMLGLQNHFTPEKLSIEASSALAYSIFELFVYSLTLYIVNIKTSLRTLDLVAFAGYKFVTIVACLLASTLFYRFGYYLALAYCSLSLGFFLLRTLKTKVLQETSSTNSTGSINYDPYVDRQQMDYTIGRKRKVYFLFLIVGGQAFLSFLLSKHLYFSK